MAEEATSARDLMDQVVTEFRDRQTTLRDRINELTRELSDVNAILPQLERITEPAQFFDESAKPHSIIVAEPSALTRAAAAVVEAFDPDPPVDDEIDVPATRKDAPLITGPQASRIIDLLEDGPLSRVEIQRGNGMNASAAGMLLAKLVNSRQVLRDGTKFRRGPRALEGMEEAA